MGLKDMQSPDMNLVLSTDAKPRLKWTPELHDRFVVAVNHLGGADKATPKSLMREMGVPGLTLFHLKSHLQKFRLGKNQQQETCTDFRKDVEETSYDLNDQGPSDASGDDQMNGGLDLAEALQMQMEVQRKLHEQIEVQRHLQLRIEAQGKYLQKVLNKAQETLAGYNAATPLGVEHTKEELSKLVSMVSSGCPDSPSSELTEAIASSFERLDQEPQEEQPQPRGRGCKIALLGSGEDLDLPKYNNCAIRDPNQKQSMLQLFDQSSWINHHGIPGNTRKRNVSNNLCGDKEEKSATKRSFTSREKNSPGLSKLGLLDTFDLNNAQYPNDAGLGPTPIDLNSKGIEQFNALL